MGQPQSRKPRFFCEHCGTEVPINSRSCLNCGRYFENIRCPACGFTGNEQLFANGCPVCSYSSPTGDMQEYEEKRKKNENRISTGSLPVWVYLVTILALFSVLFFLFNSLR